MAFFPLRHTIDCDLPPDQVIERLHHLTDSRRKSAWQRFWSVGTYLKKNSGSRRFEGEVDVLERSFRLHTNLYLSDRMQTAFSGKAEPDGSGSKLTVWISATKTGSWAVALFIAAIIYGVLPRAYQLRPAEPGLLAFVIFGIALFVGIDFLYVHNLAKRLFLETITGEADESETDLRLLGDRIRSTSPKTQHLTPSDSLVDHFLAQFDQPFGDEMTPPHTLEVSPDKKSLTITFPPQADDSYEVKAILKNDRATVWAGEWIQIPFDDPSPEDTVNQLRAALHDLLSPQCRLREKFVSGVVVIAELDSLRDEQWENGVFKYASSLVTTPGEIEDFVYINRQLPIRSGRPFL